MFHDSFKNGIENCGHTDSKHPAFAANFVLNSFSLYDVPFSVEVSRAILSHMGRWNTDREGNQILPIPNSRLDKMIHAADYIASRKYMLYMPI